MKIERHRKIIEIINKNDIETQYELAEMLNREGYNVTQATVSRDIKQLKLIKKNVGGKHKYAVYQNNTSNTMNKNISILK